MGRTVAAQPSEIKVTVTALGGREERTTVVDTAPIVVTIDSRTLQWTITIQPDGTIQSAMIARVASNGGVG
jgi:hypothetical protein